MRPSTGWSRRARRNFTLAIFLLGPSACLIASVFIWPLVNAIVLSFTDQTLLDLDRANWVGWQNYRRLLEDPAFWRVLGNTFAFALIVAVAQLIFGLTLAMLLHQPIYGKALFRGVVLLAWILPVVVLAFLWEWLFSAEFGLVNGGLERAGIITDYLPWLAHPVLSPIAVLVVFIWRSIPFMMVMCLARLETIPHEIIEAAKIDGAGGAARFRSIILPWLRPVLGLSTLVTIFWVFENYVIIRTMTGGGPADRTKTLSVLVYHVAFETFNLGQAAAMGTVWFLTLAAFAVIYFYIVCRTDDDAY